MAPSPSPDHLSRADLELLVDIADDTLAAALGGHRYEPPPLDSLPAELGSYRGAFVTLHVDGELNGCIGDVAGRQPLARSVSRLALAAAFDDRRLPDLRPDDYERLTIEVSVLSPMIPVDANDRAELIRCIRPHIDGVVVRSGSRAGLFLPDVWEQLPAATDFLDHLWRKAGLPPSVWPETIERFTTQRFERPTLVAR